MKEITLESGREYTFGRSSSCDVQLEEQPGISRQHFTVSEVDGEWTAKVIAKFGDLVHAGSPVSTLKLESGTVFKLGGYDFAFIEAIEEQESVVVSDEQDEILPMASGDMTGNLPAKYNGGGDSFAGDDDATRIISTPSTGDLYLRIVDGENRQNSIKLDSKKSIAGRDESCTISLADRKASRRQFEITSTAQGVFIRDLGSSNGTILNGMPLAADELKILRSGDVIQVGQLTIHFEVRDPSFEKRLMVVPPEILA
ncbi:MAG TPA: FHA domain-containing protein, partial [Bdellovibrionales bacterium]|nr:FHA domain-containing protein [Bdellovibrionales bacterium]